LVTCGEGSYKGEGVGPGSIKALVGKTIKETVGGEGRELGGVGRKKGAIRGSFSRDSISEGGSMSHS